MPSNTVSPPITPDIDARTTATNKVCTATPPRSRLPNTFIASNKSWAMPERSNKAAINTNIGTAKKM